MLNMSSKKVVVDAIQWLILIILVPTSKESWSVALALANMLG